MSSDTRPQTVTLENAFTGHRIVLREDPAIATGRALAAETDGVLPWQSQVRQYPATGPAGISYFAGHVDGFALPVDCLLYRGDDGALLGVLNHYPQDMPPYEEKGNVLVLVHPEHRREGIGMALMLEAIDRWELDPAGQKYSRKGMQLVASYLTTRGYKEQK